jgi:hypothetical protein
VSCALHFNVFLHLPLVFSLFAVMSCPCFSALSFSPRHAAAEVDVESPEKRCLACGQPIVDLLPVVLVTPCKLSDDIHGIFLSFCDRQSCQDSLKECAAAFAAERMGLVEHLGRVEWTDELCARVQSKFERLFTVDTARACAECGKHSWALLEGPFEWSNAKCGRCLRVWYCSVACQRRHWRSAHAATCVAGSVSSDPPPTNEEALAWAKRRLSCYSSLKELTILYIYRAHERGLCSRPQCRVRLVPRCALEQRHDVVFRHGELDLCISKAVRFCSDGCALTCGFASVIGAVEYKI